MQRAENNSYEFEARVRYSEIGHRGTMTLPALYLTLASNS